MKKMYVGNLPFSATEEEVTELFGQHGTVHSVALINDRETGRPRGFGFVEMDDDAATAAIQALDGQEMGGRALRVNEAQDRPCWALSSGAEGAIVIHWNSFDKRILLRWSRPCAPDWPPSGVLHKGAASGSCLTLSGCHDNRAACGELPPVRNSSRATILVQAR